MNRHHCSRAARCAGALLAFVFVASTALGRSDACTSFRLTAADGSPVYGRTMEMGYNLHSQAIVIPRGFAMAATGPNDKPGLTWKTRYGVVGLNSFGMQIVTDGLNEKGMAGGILDFPGYAVYADPAKTEPARALAPWDFLTWALTNFSTVADLRAALTSITVISASKPGYGGIVPQFHYALHDATGASLVVEPIGGVLKAYDNPLGVMTNAPPFEWHLTNLRNYIKLSPVAAQPLKVEGQVFAPIGQGSGMLGIPGDGTPPSRFVRALAMAMSAKPLPDGAQTVRLAEHILNNFDIPLGLVRDDATAR